MNLALPKMTSASKEFRLVLWGEDQDHFPYDFTATLTFDYTKAAENALLTSYNSMPEPASCIREATKLCGHTTAKTWPACAYEHMSQLRKAGCKGNPIGASEEPVTFDYAKTAEKALLTSFNSMPEPASCKGNPIGALEEPVTFDYAKTAE